MFSCFAEEASLVDYILDDLQQSVSRPGSSLGQPITTYSSHRDVHHLSPVNTTTVLRERSLSPNSSVSLKQVYGRKHSNIYRFPFQSNKMYKASKYEYSTASSGSYNNERGNYNEINKLDTLLNDLEHERTATLDRSKIRNCPHICREKLMNESQLCPHFATR